MGYKLTRVNSIRTGTYDQFYFFHKVFSSDNLKRNGNHLQIIGNHGQKLEITDECERKCIKSLHSVSWILNVNPITISELSLDTCGCSY